MGPKHAGGHGGGHDGPGDRHDGPGGGGHGGQGGPGGQGGQGGGGGGAPQLKDRVRKIKEELDVLREHDHISQADVEKIMQILPNHA